LSNTAVSFRLKCTLHPNRKQSRKIIPRSVYRSRSKDDVNLVTRRIHWETSDKPGSTVEDNIRSLNDVENGIGSFDDVELYTSSEAAEGRTQDTRNG
jgi:hypothetical protein